MAAHPATAKRAGVGEPSLRTIILEGSLGVRAGADVWRLDVRTGAEAIRAIDCLTGGKLFRSFRADTAVGVHYVVTIDSEVVAPDRLCLPHGRNEVLRIMPVPAGAKSGGNAGVWQAVAGVVLIGVASLFVGPAAAGLWGTAIGASGTAGLVANFGLSLALGGLAQLVAGQAAYDQPKEGRKHPSYQFGGPANRLEQGHPKPLLYGTVICGSQTVSAGVRTEDYVVRRQVGVGTVTGTGYDDPDAFESRANGLFDPDTGEWGTWVPGGGKGDSGPKEAPDSLRSAQYARTIEIIGEGEIVGPVDRYGEPVTAETLGKAIFFDGVPVQDDDGNLQFKRIGAWFTVGVPDQDAIPGFESQESEVAIGTKVEQATPIIHAVTTPDLDAVRVTIRFPALARQQKDGDLVGTTVELKIEVQPDGGGYVTAVEDTVKGKSTSGYDREYRIDLAAFGAGPWNVRVTRITADAEDTKTQSDMYFWALTEILDQKFRWPNTALCGLEFDSEQFSSIPERSFRVRGLKVLHPSNYDPLTREYSGVWNGTFSLGWTDNPAWVLMDLLRQPRYGLGRWIPVSSIDRWALYRLAQRCDELVFAGFSIEIALSAQANSGATLLSLAGQLDWHISAGTVISFSAGQTATVSADARPGDQSIAVEELEETIPTADGEDVNVGTSAAAEPRFVADLVLETPQDAARLLADVASIAWAVPFSGGPGGTVSVGWDEPRSQAETEGLFTNANVVGGTFSYTSTGRRARHTAAQVRFNDRSDHGRPAVAWTQWDDGLLQYGLNLSKISAHGTWTKGQAVRQGRWMLATENVETRVVEFTTGMDGAYLLPGSIITIADRNTQSPQNGGRLISIAAAVATLDREVTLEAGKTYRLKLIGPQVPTVLKTTLALLNADLAHNANTLAQVTADPDAAANGIYRKIGASGSGSWERRPGLDTDEYQVATAGPATTAELTLTASVSPVPADGSCWLLYSDDAEPTLWRVITRQDRPQAQTAVIAAEHRPEKFDAIEDYAIEQPSTAPLPDGTLVKPAGPLSFAYERIELPEGQLRRFVVVSWEASTDPLLRGYRFDWRYESGEWQNGQESTERQARIEVLQEGVYEVRVTVVNSIGNTSGPREAEYILTQDGVVVDELATPLIEPGGGEKETTETLLRMQPGSDDSAVAYVVRDKTEKTTTGSLFKGYRYVITDSDAENLTLTDQGGGVFHAICASIPAAKTVYVTSGGSLPAALKERTAYYTVSHGGSVKLSLTVGGDPLVAASAGTGQHRVSTASFQIGGAADNEIGTDWIHNGKTISLGDDGAYVFADGNPRLDSEAKIFTHNWLSWSNDLTQAGWAKQAGDAVKAGTGPELNETANRLDPEPDGSIDVRQIIFGLNLRETEEFTFSVWLYMDYRSSPRTGTTGEVKLQIRESGGASAAVIRGRSVTVRPNQWTRHEFTHDLEKDDRTFLEVRIVREPQDDNIDDEPLYVYGAQLAWGDRALLYQETELVGGGFLQLAQTGRQQVAAASKRGRDYSPVILETYDYTVAATKVATPDILPRGGAYRAARFPIGLRLECATPDSTITYTTDGTDPATSGTAETYAGEEILVPSGTTVRAIAAAAGLADSSERIETYARRF